MIDILHQGRADGSYYSKLKQYLMPDLLILDELGFKPLSPNTIHDFFEIISRRYEKQSTIVTSNKLFEEWATVFADKILATAIIDRLVHHCHPIVIKGESFRVKDHLDNDKNKN